MANLRLWLRKKRLMGCAQGQESTTSVNINPKARMKGEREMYTKMARVPVCWLWLPVFDNWEGVKYGLLESQKLITGQPWKSRRREKSDATPINAHQDGTGTCVLDVAAEAGCDTSRGWLS